MSEEDQSVALHFAKQDAKAQANAMPLPGPLAVAFTENEITVGAFKVRRIVAGDWRTFQKIGSALMLDAAELDKPEGERKSHWDDATDAQLIWILTHTRKEVREALNAGVEAFKERCQEETLDIMDGPTSVKLVEAVVEQLRRASSTIVQHGSGDKDDGTVFLAATVRA